MGLCAKYMYIKQLGGLVQDGRVEGRALTPSCENTAVTTNC